MRNVTLEDLLTDSVCRKHLPKAGVDHSIRVAEIAVDLAVELGVNPDHAAKAGLLHDIGHGDFHVAGVWNYTLYAQGDIHPIKGAERAHELMVLKGEDPALAREIALAILFHSGSNAIRPVGERTPLQAVVSLADDGDEEDLGAHHKRQSDWPQAIARIRLLDQRIDELLKKSTSI